MIPKEIQKFSQKKKLNRKKMIPIEKKYKDDIN